MNICMKMDFQGYILWRDRASRVEPREIRPCITICSAWTFCYGDEENGHCACTSGHLTTANQSEIRKAYLVSVFKNLYV